MSFNTVAQCVQVSGGGWVTVGDYVRIANRLHINDHGPAIGLVCRVLSVQPDTVLVEWPAGRNGYYAKLLRNVEKVCDADSFIDEGL